MLNEEIKKQVDKLYQHRPCNDCLFRKKNGITQLGEAKAKQIIKGNLTHGFVCHKTTEVSGKGLNRKQCAGAVLIARKENEMNMFEVAYRSTFKCKLGVSNKEDIVDSYKEFIEIQSTNS